VTDTSVTIYTDGSSLGNPGPGGWGAVLIWADSKKELSRGYIETTNNRMEIRGVLHALEHLFNVANQDKTVKDAAEAAMREVIGYNKIDAALTDDKLTIQNDTRDQIILIGFRFVDKTAFILFCAGDILESVDDLPGRMNILQLHGDSDRFLFVLEEYRKAKDITKKRIYLETMEEILSRPEVEKIIISNDSMQRVFPYLPCGILPEQIENDRCRLWPAGFLFPYRPEPGSG